MRLNHLYSSMSVEQRRALAARADVAVGYLWQIATRWRGRRPSLDVIKQLVDADPRLTVEDLVDEFSEPAQAAAPPEVNHG